jgi:hypothetical protein
MSTKLYISVFIRCEIFQTISMQSNLVLSNWKGSIVELGEYSIRPSKSKLELPQTNILIPGVKGNDFPSSC